MAKQDSLSIIARNVTALREANRWNQTQLARHAGISQKVVSNIERASELRISPTMDTISALAAAFGVPEFILLIPLSDYTLLKAMSNSVGKKFDAYVQLPAAGRQTVDRIIDLEASTGRL